MALRIAPSWIKPYWITRRLASVGDAGQPPTTDDIAHTLQRADRVIAQQQAEMQRLVRLIADGREQPSTAPGVSSTPTIPFPSHRQPDVVLTSRAA